MRYFLEISYNGTAYHGWQIQENAHSIQAEFEKALSKLLRSNIRVMGQGRTDTGVHAISSWLHFNSEFIPPRFIESINGILPSDLSVNRIFPVKEDAHARFSALSRSYRYHIHHRKSPFLKGRSAFLKKIPDYNQMKLALSYLLGRQDFECFSKIHTNVKTFICTIHSVQLEVNLESGTAIFYIEADRFLRNMVRAIVGTLLEIGYGRLAPEDMKKIIEAKSRSNVGTSAPACGLFLTQVRYPNAIFEV